MDRTGRVCQLSVVQEHRYAAKNIMPQHLCPQLLYDVAVNVRQTEISSSVTIRQPLVIKPESVEQRRVQIVHVDRFFYWVISELVG